MRNALPAARSLSRFLAVSLGLHLVVLLGFSADWTRLAQVPGTRLKGTLITSGADIQKSPALTTGAVPHPKPTVASAAKNIAPALAEHEVAPAAKSSTQEGVSGDAVRQYLFLLVPEARRLKRYPALARERGWEGQAEITVKLDGVQSVPAVVLTRSSGFPMLDEQALAMIGQAARVVAVPEFLRGKNVAIPVPVRFSLED